MLSFCFYFQIHQPYRLRFYSYFAIGHQPFYQDEEKKALRVFAWNESIGYTMGTV
jgi:hypothetical protein